MSFDVGRQRLIDQVTAVPVQRRGQRIQRPPNSRLHADGDRILAHVLHRNTACSIVSPGDLAARLEIARRVCALRTLPSGSSWPRCWTVTMSPFTIAGTL